MEDDTMINVLCVGKYNDAGIFTKKQWECFLEWCKEECNKLIVYSRMSYSTICSKFSLCCSIDILNKPDETLDIYAYEINVTCDWFWSYIKDYNYNIDIVDALSHIYFFSSERYVASLELVDYENYILIEEVEEQQNELLLDKALTLENIQLCFEGKTDIDGLIQEDWKPLGS